MEVIAGNKNRASGFTLIELLVTLSVAVVLVTMAVPSFYSLVETNRLAVASNDVLSSVLFARSQAITKKLDTSVILVGSDGWPMTVVIGGDVVASREKPSGANLSVVWSSTPSVDFDPVGRASREASLCISSSGGLHKEIRIYLSGQVKAYEKGVFINCY